MFVPIQLVTDMDGTEFLLVLTGGQNTAGGLYKIPLYSMSRPLSRVRIEHINVGIVVSGGFVIVFVFLFFTARFLSLV